MKKILQIPQIGEAIIEYSHKKHSDCADVSKINVTTKVDCIYYMKPVYNQDGYGTNQFEKVFMTREQLLYLIKAFNGFENGEVTQVPLKNFSPSEEDELPF